MVTYQSVAFRHTEATEKWRVWVCSRGHIVHAVNPKPPEAVELTDTAESNSSPSEECVTEPALGKNMQAHTCACRKNRLVRAAHPTSGVQNPC